MSANAIKWLQRRTYAELNDGRICLVVGVKPGAVKCLVVSDTNGDLIDPFSGGMTEAEYDARIEGAPFFVNPSFRVKQMIQNSVDPITNSVFTFQNGDTVPISQNGFDASGYSTQDQANYIMARDLFVMLCG